MITLTFWLSEMFPNYLTFFALSYKDGFNSSECGSLKFFCTSAGGHVKNRVCTDRPLWLDINGFGVKLFIPICIACRFFLPKYFVGFYEKEVRGRAEVSLLTMLLLIYLTSSSRDTFHFDSTHSLLLIKQTKFSVWKCHLIL